MSTTVNLFINAVIVGAGLGVGYLMVNGAWKLVHSRDWLDKLSMSKALDRMSPAHKETLNALFAAGKAVPKSAALAALGALKFGCDRAIVLIDHGDGTVSARHQDDVLDEELLEKAEPVTFGPPPTS